MSAPPQAKGQIQRKKPHRNQPLQIQIAPWLRSHQLQAAQPEIWSIHSFLDFNTMHNFQVLQNVSTAFSGECNLVCSQLLNAGTFLSTLSQFILLHALSLLQLLVALNTNI